MKLQSRKQSLTTQTTFAFHADEIITLLYRDLEQWSKESRSCCVNEF